MVKEDISKTDNAKTGASFRDSSLDMETRLDLLISELTIDEKLHMLASGSAGVERLGIPDCKLGGEAAHGVEARNDQNGIGTPEITTSFPQPIGMSSSWDREAIHAAGEVVGREARIVYGRNHWGGISRWAPTVDLLRDPRWGRNEEAYGEDPVQVGAMASEYIRGIQGDDPKHLMCAATLKHFYANNTEIGRAWKNVSISPRNKYESYLEPFRRCIEDGHVEGVMTAYNRINGVQGLFNEDVKDLLKAEFGLTHAVSDGGAMELSALVSHATAMDAESVAGSIKAGVDALSGRPERVYAGALEAYELGLLTEEDMDTAIRNVYRTRIRLGLLDDDCSGRKDPGELCSKEAREACKRLTDSSVVLLKNDGALPIKDDDLKDTVLIGPVGDRWYMDWYGGEAPDHISLLDGLNARADAAGAGDIAFSDACDRITLESGGKYISADPDGRYRLSETPDVFIHKDWGEGSHTLRDEKTGNYMSTVLAYKAVEGIASGESDTVADITGNVCVGKDRIFSWFDLEVFRMNVTGDSEITMCDRFGNRLWADRNGYIVSAQNGAGLTPLTFTVHIVKNGIEEAVDLASKADRVILALGHNPMVNAKEEIDRSTISFIPSQHKLFDEIRRVNPNIIVVLMSDYPFAIVDINEHARAVLWTATGSQCMGASVADALTGKFSPAGRLTQTWYRSDDDLPDIDDYDIIGGSRTYRYFDGEVLYPFGFGLTYTTFGYDDLKAEISQPADNAGTPDPGKAQDRIKAQDTPSASACMTSEKSKRPADIYADIKADGRCLNISLTVTNTGGCASDEVVQVYVRALSSPVRRPGKQLIAFERIKDVAPGEKRRVDFVIPVRELAYYDVVSEKLIIEEGDYEVTVGSSSADSSPASIIHISGRGRGLRDLTHKIRADHYDSQKGSQITQGLYGYTALTSAGPNVYTPAKDGHFEAVYTDCVLTDERGTLRIHGIAPDNATITVYADGIKAGGITLNTRDYSVMPPWVRNHMPRAAEAERLRLHSFPVLWADIKIPLDLSGIKDLSPEHGHELRIEVDGGFMYDWFMMV